ncbi:hypothetical protein ACTWPT_44460 [Nonomuraea sp. 3N208]|uniref:hypothetical protein n=1 Tax=Nonomuraea sp. 3N208 TaxID=3457421 RepID=UPI003FCFEE96
MLVQGDLPQDALTRPRGEKREGVYRQHGMHMLRHFFASTLLTTRESPKAVAEWMGHTDGCALPLKVYAHLMATSEQRMRRAVDAALGRPAISPDGPQTAQEIISGLLSSPYVNVRPGWGGHAVADEEAGGVRRLVVGGVPPGGVVYLLMNPPPPSDLA